MASIDPTIESLLAHASTANHAWNILQTTYANKSHSRKFSLRDTLKKDSCSVGECMKEIKSIVDDLPSSGSLLLDEEIVIKVLSGLGSDYKELYAAIRARNNPIFFEELYNELLTHELNTSQAYPNHHLNNSSQYPTSFNPSYTNRNNQQRIQCQIVDSGASHHITNSSQSLQACAEFLGTDEIIVGDGFEHESMSSARSG
ncbi:uncharacterized protein LOC107797565 [Nicotiana tabacum]|uniref:Uncharacterized protein LOC107797565 n=1 Tax=Nicotiana tabacum TaxID=4097 RepID=A0AC58UQ52_TOBAC